MDLYQMSLLIDHDQIQIFNSEPQREDMELFYQNIRQNTYSTPAVEEGTVYIYLTMTV